MTTTASTIKIEAPTSLLSRSVSVGAIFPLIENAAEYLAVHSHATTSTDARSVELAGFAKKVFPESCRTPFSSETVQHFNEFIHARSKLVEKPSVDQAIKWDRATQRLLVVKWSDSLFDGACSPITNGFIDDDCMPGWDTWLAIVSLDDHSETHGLLSWIPCKLVSSVDAAITIDAASCMSWILENVNGDYTLHGWGQSRM